MGRLSGTVFTGRPRVMWRSADEAGLVTRSNDADGWKSLWDSKVLADAATYAAQTDDAIATDKYNGHLKVLCLMVAGIVENNPTYRSKAIDVAEHYANNYADTTDYNSTVPLRVGAYMMAYAYDGLFSVAEMSSTEKAAIRAGLKKQAARLLHYVDQTGDQLLSGHSAGNAVAMLACGLAYCTEDADGYDKIDDAIDFWFGSGAGVEGRIESERYFAANGGMGKGVWYSLLSQWYTQLLLRFIHCGFVRNADTPGSLEYDGEGYEPYTDEDWVGKVGEWFLRFASRGDKDYLSWGDTDRVDNPVMHEYAHLAISALVGNGGGWRKPLHWLWNRMWDWAGTESQQTGYVLVPDFILFDKAAAANEATVPKDVPVARSKFFNPPGAFHSISPVFDPPNACDITIKMAERWFRNHHHLDVGCIDIGIKEDRVLLDTGMYKTSDVAANFGGTHNNNWTQQSIAHSGVPLIEGSADDGSDEHYNYDDDGYRETYKNAKGGQSWKTIGGISGTFDPDNLDEMLNDGGGEAWKRAVATHPQSQEGVADFVVCDARKAYLKEHTDLDGALERARVCKLRHLVIYNVAPWPVIFRVAQVESRLPGQVKRDHWHFANSPILDANKRFRAMGFRRVGWCAIDYYEPLQYTYRLVGGPISSSGIGEHDFEWDGVNWRPTGGCPDRWKPDIGHYRMEVRPAVQMESQHFVCLIMPFLDGESPPAYSWFEEADYFGVDFSGAKFRIHKTQDQAVWEAVDTQPPAAPTMQGATPGPSVGAVTPAWLPNTDDTVLYRGYWRAKA